MRSCEDSGVVVAKKSATIQKEGDFPKFYGTFLGVCAELTASSVA